MLWCCHKSHILIVEICNLRFEFTNWHYHLQDGETLTTIVPTGAYSIAFSRTPAEVLAIVYLGSATTPGGFFPNGLNGSIK